MTTIVRQPFAPLDGARLQTLTSLKNRQNAISNAPVKRKASEVEVDDSENVDPALFSKRSKGAGADNDFKDFFKPSKFVLTKATSTPSLPSAKDVLSDHPVKPQPSKRQLLQPKSPAARLNTTITSSSLTAPAGRSPTRGSKRIGILSRRRTQRVDPPAFGLGSSAPFSLDAALKGTIPSYSGSFRSAASNLLQPDTKSDWFFDIHEDTPEQEMTNLLQHSTCTLDISSDEESEQRARREQAEGRDKENIPPADDVSQTTSARASRAAGVFDDMVIEKQRGPLSDLNVEDYYAEGCDGTSVIIVPGDEEDAVTVIDEAEHASRDMEPLETIPVFEEPASTTLAEIEAISVDELMCKDEPALKAAALQPIEGTGESFELWESGSFRDENEAPPSPAPAMEPVLAGVSASC